MERVSRLEREAQLLKRIGEDKQQLMEKLDAERVYYIPDPLIRNALRSSLCQLLLLLLLLPPNEAQEVGDFRAGIARSAALH